MSGYSDVKAISNLPDYCRSRLLIDEVASYSVTESKCADMIKCQG